jgi:hypothetical protein
MLVLSDTHGEDPRLTDHLREAVADARLVHAGDFTTREALEGFEALASEVTAVAGNRDSAAVRARLPAVATVEAAGLRFVVVHGHEHDRTSLSLLARQEGADVAVVGHSHRPGIERSGDLTVLNPGSHADPRGNRPAYATVGQVGARRAELRLHTPDGEAIDGVRL